MATVLKFSEAAALALHAAVYLAALPIEEAVSAPALARICGASQAHMTKVCQRLARAGLLTAQRGPHGGFQLAENPARLRLLDIYEAIEGTVESHACLFPNRVCRGSRRGGCVFGKQVLEMEKQFVRYLKTNTVAEVAKGVRTARAKEVGVTSRSVRRAWPALLALVAAVVMVGLALRPHGRAEGPAAVAYKVPTRSHLDHAPYFTSPVTSPQEVTKACLRCHPKAAEELMRTAHWQWLGREVVVPGHDGTTRIGKRNLLNNFCINVTGNWAACTKCHAGYGWADESFDFSAGENVDCLVCHERTGTYVKGPAGVPVAGIDLAAAAKSVGFPRRENCSVCHSYGGGGQGVKHGDLDGSLENPSDEDDVHMGRYGFLCIDCHRAKDHEIPGRAFSVSVEDANGVHCDDCHQGEPHADPRLNRHLASLACQTCHIPTYARKLPTKTEWDWSKAGDAQRPEDPHHYLRIKGEFVYGRDLVPEYQWFNLTADRYLLGDRVDPEVETDINHPRGDIHDPGARIWPFRVHRAVQPYDRRHDILLPPVTGGEGGYWQTFDWDSALRLGARANGVAYSGEYGFTRTRMYWPLSHAVTPKNEALACTDCHVPGGRMDWAVLGYTTDPIETGGRR